MALNKTPVYRNLGTRVTFLYLEYEDLIAVLLIAPVSFFLGSLFDRELVRHTDETRIPVGNSGDDRRAAAHVQVRKAARLSCAIGGDTRPSRTSIAGSSGIRS